MDENEIDYEFIKHQLLLLLEKYEEKLGRETVDSVRSFIDHDEYEMACEGLFIDMMNIGFDPSDVGVGVYIKIGEDLNLNEGSVFEEGFLERFEGYLDKWKAR